MGEHFTLTSRHRRSVEKIKVVQHDSAGGVVGGVVIIVVIVIIASSPSLHLDDFEESTGSSRANWRARVILRSSLWMLSLVLFFSARLDSADMRFLRRRSVLASSSSGTGAQPV